MRHILLKQGNLEAALLTKQFDYSFLMGGVPPIVPSTGAKRSKIAIEFRTDLDELGPLAAKGACRGRLAAHCTVIGAFPRATGWPRGRPHAGPGNRGSTSRVAQMRLSLPSPWTIARTYAPFDKGRCLGGDKPDIVLQREVAKAELFRGA